MSLGNGYNFIESLRLLIVSHHNKMHQQNGERVLNEFDTNTFFDQAEKILIDIRKAEIKVDFESLKKRIVTRQ